MDPQVSGAVLLTTAAGTGTGAAALLRFAAAVDTGTGES
jgi:hypothetical protein